MSLGIRRAIENGACPECLSYRCECGEEPEGSDTWGLEDTPEGQDMDRMGLLALADEGDL